MKNSVIAQKPFEVNKNEKWKKKEFSFSLSPLFFIFGIYYAVIGRFFEFAVYTVSAVLHELGHAYSAKRRGYELKSISLNAYGASVSGNFSALKNTDGLAIYSAGPVLSLFVAFFTAGSWWFFPETFCVTEIIYQANLSLGLSNLLPIAPLDGGKIFEITLAKLLGKKFAKAVSLVIGLSLTAFMFVLFLIPVFTSRNVNFSLLIFALFVLTGTFDKDGKSEYVLRRSGIKHEDFKRGISVKTFAVDESTPVKRLYGLMDYDCFNSFSVYSKGKEMGTVDELDLERFVLEFSIYDAVSKIVGLKKNPD